MSTPEYTLYVRNRSLQYVGELDDWNSLELFVRYNNVGAFTLEVNADTTYASALLTPGNGLVVVRNSVVIFSGPIDHMEYTRSQDTALITLTGPDDMTYLVERLCYPEAPALTTSVSGHDTQGPGVLASTALLHYVNVNLGPSAALERQVPGLVMGPDPLVGPTGTWRARFQVVNDIIGGIAVYANLSYRLVQSGTSLVFLVSAPADRSLTARFGYDFDNLDSFSYTRDSSQGNFVVVGGGQEMINRVFLQRPEPTSIVNWRRKEFFRDRRDTTDALELSQTADEELATRGEQLSLSLKPKDTEAVAFGRDYFLGDVISIETEPAIISDVVREVHLTINGDGAEQIEPVVGTPGVSTAAFQAWDALRRLANRLHFLETVQ